jgi:hypothetical protein
MTSYDFRKEHQDIYFIVHNFHRLRYKKTKRNKQNKNRTKYYILEQNTFRNKALYWRDAPTTQFPLFQFSGHVVDKNKKTPGLYVPSGTQTL